MLNKNKTVEILKGTFVICYLVVKINEIQKIENYFKTMSF